MDSPLPPSLMKNPRGGARPGAGRKPTGPKTVSTNFTLSPETFAGLQAIPRGARSKFVDAAIREKLGDDTTRKVPK